MAIWTTPQRIFSVLDREFSFCVDLCADADNSKCRHYLLRDQSLSSDWKSVWHERSGGSSNRWCWLNPPYGYEIADWTKKALDSEVPIVAFLPARTNAPWWHDHVMRSLQIRFVRRKVSFAGGKSGVPPWGCATVLFANHDESRPLSCISWDYKDPEWQSFTRYPDDAFPSIESQL